MHRGAGGQPCRRRARAAVADERERRPEYGVSIGEHGAARRIREDAVVDERDHRPAVGLGSAQSRVGDRRPRRCQPSTRWWRPSAPASSTPGASERRHRRTRVPSPEMVSAPLPAPAAVLQADRIVHSALRRSPNISSMVNSPVARAARRGRVAHGECRLGQAVELARHQPVGRERDHSVFREFAGATERLDPILVRCGSEVDVARGIGAQDPPDGHDLRLGVGQRRERFETRAPHRTRPRKRPEDHGNASRRRRWLGCRHRLSLLGGGELGVSEACERTLAGAPASAP